MDQLFQETRQDIKEMKETLVSIDKNLSVTVEKMNQISERTAKLEERVNPIEDHVKLVNASAKVFALLGGILLFFAEIVPLLKSFIVH